MTEFNLEAEIIETLEAYRELSIRDVTIAIIDKRGLTYIKGVFNEERLEIRRIVGLKRIRKELNKMVRTGKVERDVRTTTQSAPRFSHSKTPAVNNMTLKVAFFSKATEE